MKTTDRASERKAASRTSARGLTSRRKRQISSRRLRSQIDCIQLKASIQDAALDRTLLLGHDSTLDQQPAAPDSEQPLDFEKTIRLGLPHLQQLPTARLRVLVGGKPALSALPKKAAR